MADSVQTIPFGEWLPDLPPFDNPGATVASGVIPTAKGYRPFPGTEPIGTALNGRVRGAATALAVGNVTQIFAGTADKLYRYISGAWADASVTAGYTTADEYWQFAQFGDRIFATNYNDPIQSMTLSDSNFMSLSTSAPQARSIGVIGQPFNPSPQLQG